MRKLIIFILISFSIGVNAQMLTRMIPTMGIPDTVVSAADAQNLILYSEQIDNAVWETSSGITSVTANQGTDGNGNNTLERVVTNTGEAFISQLVNTNLSTETDYVFSIEVYGTDAYTDFSMVVRNRANFGTIATYTYGGSITGSVQRFNLEFTSPASMTQGLQFRICYSSYGADGDINIGRIHVYEGNTGDKSYTTTISSQVTGD